MRVREDADGNFKPCDALGVSFDKLLVALKLKRPGISFYALRHVFRTIADGCKDQPAVDHVMGHSDPSMAGRYRERIDDSRLKDVVNVVRRWLW